MDQPSRCRECQAPLESPIGCLHCHSIFPSSTKLSHFDRLGIPQRFDLDRKELDRRYLAWSRELHPDYFQTKSETEQSWSLSLSASLNDAYATLREPFRRAEYLLHLYGGPAASEHRSMPEGFLERVLEVRMSIEEAVEEGDSESLATLKQQIEGERNSAMDAVADRFRELDSEPESDKSREATLTSIRELLNTVKYYDGLLRETESAR